MKKIFTFLLVSFCLFELKAGDSLSVEYENYNDSVNATFKYQTGNVAIGDKLATIKVPAGFRYLDPKQSEYVLHELWGNPPASSLGMLIPEKYGPMDPNCWVIDISYSEEGYIEDDDAKDMDYDDLLEEMQTDTEEGNAERVKQSYPSIQLIGWATPPFYDEKNKKLHWAKELKFDGDSLNTLNYNIRVLGRKGYLVLNAIGSMEILPEVKKEVNKVLGSVDFTEGNKYTDFDPEYDEVAAYGIGGLITGKILAKAGFFVLLAKFWKVIAAAVVGAFYVIRKKFFGGNEQAPVVAQTVENNENKIE